MDLFDLFAVVSGFMLRATVAPLGPTVSSRGIFDVTAYGADPTATHEEREGAVREGAARF